MSVLLKKWQFFATGSIIFKTPPLAYEFYLFVSWDRVFQSFIVCVVVFSDHSLDFSSIFCWPLYGLSHDLRLLITPLLPLDFSFNYLAK